MSQNNPTILYAGLDIAKASLQLSLCGRSYGLPNTAAGHRRLLPLLTKAHASQPGMGLQVILEATGGYEAGVVAALHEVGLPLSVIQPARARHFAQARAAHAKTDPIDAAVLAAFGAALQPAPTPKPSPAQLRLTALVNRRAQLVELRVAEVNRAEHYNDPFVRQQSRQLLALFDRQITAANKAIAAQLKDDPAMHQRSKRLQSVQGLGPVITAVLQAHLPELGSVADNQAAALAGLAPYNRDSGSSQGIRFIRGGRATVRCALYMASLSSIRHDPILKNFYLRLRSAGKPKMLALTAVMRKLLVLLNRLLRNPNFQLLSALPPSPSASL